MSPRHVFPSRVMVPSSQPVSLVGQMAFSGNACEGCVRGFVPWVWCTYLPHLVHLLTFLSLLGYVSPRRVFIPCHASFVTGSEFGWANGVFWQCTRELCEELSVVHIPAPSCALADVPFSRGLCLPATCFHPVSCFSFVAACEFGCANGVFRQCMRGLCEELWHGCGAHTCPILCTC